MNLYGGIIMMACLLLTGCSFLQDTGDAAQNLLVLRATYQVPAEQAGVLELAEQQASRLDAAIASGDVDQVRSVLRSMEPVYRDIYASVDSPTPEQVAFHARVLELWEYLEQDEAEMWRELAVVVLTELFRRVP